MAWSACAFIDSHPCHPWCNRISFDIKQIYDGARDSRTWLSMEDGVLLRAISRWWMRRGDIVVFTWKTNLLTFFSSSGTSSNTENVGPTSFGGCCRVLDADRTRESPVSLQLSQTNEPGLACVLTNGKVLNGFSIPSVFVLRFDLSQSQCRCNECRHR